MKSFTPFALLAFLTLLALAFPAKLAAGGALRGPAAYVDPMVGTAASGNTFPGAVLPFGMVSFSPEELRSDPKHSIPAGGYSYDASLVRGFSLTHLSGAGCAGSGDFPFMPIAGAVEQSPSLDPRNPAYLSRIRHSQEHAEAGYYSVRLENGVLVQLTATLRTGAARFAYPAGKPATLLIRSSDNETISTDSEVKIDPARRTVSGSLKSGGFCRGGAPSSYDSYYRIFFVARFAEPFSAWGTWKDGAVQPNSTASAGGTADARAQDGRGSGKGSGAYVSFRNAAGTVIRMEVGISYVSAANAEANLRAESPARMSFATLRAHARSAWDSALRHIAVSGGTEEQEHVFYTALYHSLLYMNLASDVNGEYWGMNQRAHRVLPPQSAQYANFSGWDVYRSQMQLVALLFPDVASDMAQSLQNQAEQWGCWSRWTHQTGAANVMNGDPSAAAIADVVAFGAVHFDVKGAYASLLQAATVPQQGHRCSRAHLDEWMSRHYLTASNPKHDTSVSDTLEYCAADFALAQLAGAEGDAANQRMLLQRAQSWKNLYNPRATATEGYLQARDQDGSWKSFNPASREGFVEGTGAQYLWMVPFEAQGLFALLGGDAQANRRLDAFFHNADGSWAFTAGKLHPGLENEPSLATPWLYDLSGEPYKTQQTVRAILTALWRDGPDGIPGNDDLGEMSSWYVWAAMGMYPVMPGRSELLLSSPLFGEITVRNSLRAIRIHTQPQGPSAVFVRSLRVDGQLWRRPWLPADFVRHGGRLDFLLSRKIQPEWGVPADDARPPFEQR